MTTSTPARIAAGVTTAYLRDLTHRSAPTIDRGPRRATSRIRPRTTAEAVRGLRAGRSDPRSDCSSRERASASRQSGRATAGLAQGRTMASTSGFARERSSRAKQQ
ncbi:MAG: hypothetical protein QOH46_3326 [Solirubrobacteraceae bacterium]|jgi:hypothetical protein|nr:hypothetical protein [Solirubrobacteraceae bacterium]